VFPWPWGKQSGAHFNPGITVAFFWLGKVELWDAFWYATGQFLGGISGVAIATAVLRGAPGDGTVRYAVTVPGVYGDGAAFVAELIISFILMSAILFTSNRESLSPYTPYFSGALIAVYLTLEAPLSGASANPARSLGSALHAGYWHALWIYFVAPPLGMLAAAEVFLRARGGSRAALRQAVPRQRQALHIPLRLSNPPGRKILVTLGSMIATFSITEELRNET